MPNYLIPHCVNLALALLGTIDASPEVVRPPSESTAVAFKHSDDHLGQKLLLALGFVTFVGAGAFVLVRLRQDGRLALSPGVARKWSGAKILDFKRVSGKLVIVTLELSSGAVVTVADNGMSVCVLDRVEPVSRNTESEGVGIDRAS
jgi:hypothetical protein